MSQKITALEAPGVANSFSFNFLEEKVELVGIQDSNRTLHIVGRKDFLGNATSYGVNMQIENTCYLETLASTPTNNFLLLDSVEVLSKVFFFISPSTWLFLANTLFTDSCALTSPDLSMS